MNALIKITKFSVILFIVLCFSSAFSQIRKVTKPADSTRQIVRPIDRRDRVFRPAVEIANPQILEEVSPAPNPNVLPQNPKNVALLIGNSAYTGFNALDTPVQDINLIAQNLTKFGYEVIKVENATKQEMLIAIGRFMGTSRDAAVTFFYYAGHTVTSNGKNYLVPVDATLQNAQALLFETVDLDVYIRRMDPKKQNLISIDACYRNNFPFNSGDSPDEPCFVTPTNYPDHTFISFASSQKLIGLGTNQSNSLFASTFSKNMQSEPYIRSAYLKSKIEIKKDTNGQQGITVFGNLTDRMNWNGMVAMISPMIILEDFPWPPPEPSAKVDADVFEAAFENCQTLKEINDILITALRNHGYSGKNYYAISKDGINHGFAIATQLEQINEDATSKDPPDRWKEELLKETKNTGFSFKKLFESLFLPNKGYFRVFVFAVTDLSITEFGAGVSRKEALSWVEGTSDELPPEIKNKDTENYKVRAYIYEYKLSENTIEAILENPSVNPGLDHIIKSQLGQELIKD